MRYKIVLDQLANQLMPYFWRGRKTILYFQSLIHPLQIVNDKFVEFAKEKHIEARMTSQVVYFEWFLNHKLNKYFLNPEDKIVISDVGTLAVDIYNEGAINGKPFTVWNDLGETIVVVNPEELPKELYYKAEDIKKNRVSFVVTAPNISIPQSEFVWLVSSLVNKYKTAGKTYLIAIGGIEIEPLT